MYLVYVGNTCELKSVKIVISGHDRVVNLHDIGFKLIHVEIV